LAALMSQPRLLLLDEPSLGLAPIIIQQIFDTEQLRKEGMTIFLVEQNANQALKLADRGYVLENGSRGAGRHRVTRCWRTKQCSVSRRLGSKRRNVRCLFSVCTSSRGRGP
jgi:ABC-type lipopolysaccharide export system ATPase subunit